jgi:hypothetical protein
MVVVPRLAWIYAVDYVERGVYEKGAIKEHPGRFVVSASTTYFIANHSFMAISTIFTLGLLPDRIKKNPCSSVVSPAFGDGYNNSAFAYLY